MKEKNTGKDLFIISIITIISITVWVVLDVYLTFQKRDIPTVVKKQMEPLSPKLNTEVLDELEKKQYFDLTQEEFPPTIAITPTIEIPNASPTAEIQKVPTGTESANF